MQLRLYYALACVVALLVILPVDSLASIGPTTNAAAAAQCTRRTAMAVLLVGSSSVVTPAASSAYERRDVGGEDRSPEQAAYNAQAFETNNRLEREGMILETAEEQKASLMAALADYSYDETPENKEKSKDKRKSKIAESK